MPRAGGLLSEREGGQGTPAHDRPPFVILYSDSSQHAALKKGTHFSVVVTEGWPDSTGLDAARRLAEARAGIPVTLIPDTAAAAALEGVDMVLVGAEGVAESGGIVNKVGTYQIALCARALGKPVYVAAESYKFARIFPLNQRDLPAEASRSDPGQPRALPSGLRVASPSRDYTPPAYLTLLFTDLGVLTPSAVSDELIQLYR